MIINQKDWKYQHLGTDFFCSSECVIKGIESYQTSDSINPDKKYKSSPISGVEIGSNHFYSKKLHRRFRSDYEVKVAEFFDTRSINFRYEPYCFELGRQTLTPDFYIDPPYDCFVEVKGAFSIGGKAKLTKFLAVYPEVNYIFIPWTLREDFYCDTYC